MGDRRRCSALQHSDQMVCDACNLVWDVNDPAPPECGKERLHRLLKIGSTWQDHCPGAAMHGRWSVYTGRLRDGRHVFVPAAEGASSAVLLWGPYRSAVPVTLMRRFPALADLLGLPSSMDLRRSALDTPDRSR